MPFPINRNDTNLEGLYEQAQSCGYRKTRRLWEYVFSKYVHTKTDRVGSGPTSACPIVYTPITVERPDPTKLSMLRPLPDNPVVPHVKAVKIRHWPEAKWFVVAHGTSAALWTDFSDDGSALPEGHYEPVFRAGNPFNIPLGAIDLFDENGACGKMLIITIKNWHYDEAMSGSWRGPAVQHAKGEAGASGQDDESLEAESSYKIWTTWGEAEPIPGTYQWSGGELRGII